MSENDTDTALILATAMMKEVAELPASELRDNELRDLCAEVQAMVSQPEQFEEFEEAHDEMNEYLARRDPEDVMWAEVDEYCDR